MSLVKIKQFLLNPKKCTLRFNAVHMQTEDNWLIADESGIFSLKLADSFKKGRKLLCTGKYLRAVFPASSSCNNIVFLDDGSTIVPCSPFKTVEVDQTAVENFSSHAADTSSNHIDTPLKEAGTKKPGEKVQSILVKVLLIGVPKKIHNGSEVARVTVKDETGEKNVLSLWNKKIEEVKLGTVYRIQNLRVEDFPRGNEKKQLTSHRNTVIIEVQDSAGKFSEISLADGMTTGTCLGLVEFYFYSSCPKCFKKVEGTATSCQSCKEEFECQREDFKAELLLQTCDDVKTFVVFRSKIDEVIECPNVFCEDSSAVEARLNENLLDKNIVVAYTEQRDGFPVVFSISRALTLVDNDEMME